MNKHNKEKWKAVNDNSGVYKKHFNHFMNNITFKRNVIIILSVLFKTMRGCLFISCLDKGMHLYAANDYAFNKPMSDVANMLDSHGWQISESGKLT